MEIEWNSYGIVMKTLGRDWDLIPGAVPTALR